jgi:hypothetical protein
LQKLLDAADGNQWDDKKERDETHALLEREVCHGSALAASRSSRRFLPSPTEELGADNKKEHHLSFSRLPYVLSFVLNAIGHVSARV